MRTSTALSLLVFTFAGYVGSALAQTTAGTSATIVIPIIAQTQSFASEVTVYNPNGVAINVAVAFYDAQNTEAPGPKPCTSLPLASGRSAQFAIATQCALPAISNFGLLIMTETSGTQRFYGYARTETPHGIGFSTEGFPIENFNDQLQHATGLKRLAAGAGLPAYQTNCFVTSLSDAVSYELRLFDGTTHAQLGGTLAGSLQPFQQFRYLDVFAMAGVPAGNRSNVRAQFTNLTGASKKLIGFCTVQENQNFSADFRIAKSYGGTPQNAFVQGGNAFGTTALLGTTDNQPLNVNVNGQRVMRYEPNADSPNLIGGRPNNSAGAFIGQTVAGGGSAGSGNATLNHFATVSGGWGNQAHGNSATVAGGFQNTASGFVAMVGGGSNNLASGSQATVGGGSSNRASGSFATIGGGINNAATTDYATVVGGSDNAAQGQFSLAAGRRAKATTHGSFIWADSQNFDFQPSVNNFFGVRATGGVGLTVAINAGGGVSQFCNLLPGVAAWQCTSDRDAKENFAPVNGEQILERLLAMPLATWNFKGADENMRLLGPTAQDFHAAFGLGIDDKTIIATNLHGVALAAIQGLGTRLKEREIRIEHLLQDRNAQIAEQRRIIDAQQAALAEQERRLVALETHLAGVAAKRDAAGRLAAARGAVQRD